MRTKLFQVLLAGALLAAGARSLHAQEGGCSTDAYIDPWLERDGGNRVHAEADVLSSGDDVCQWYASFYYSELYFQPLGLTGFGSWRFLNYMASYPGKVLDTCHPSPQTLDPIPMSETFPGSFSQKNGGAFFEAPPVENFDVTDDWNATAQTFADNIGQSGPRGPAPDECWSITGNGICFSTAGPPYLGGTLYFIGAHWINGGSDSYESSSGFNVYKGCIAYYADHGDNETCQ